MTAVNQPYAPVPATKVRPLGVTILAVLNALSALSFIFIGVGMIAVTATGILAGLGIILGGFVILIGVVQLLIAFGLWKGWGWAWFVALIFGILGIIFGLLSLTSGLTGILGLVINIVIVYYLFQPRVKAYFGR